MIVKKLVSQPNGENTYCLDIGDAWVVVDPGMPTKYLLPELQEKPCVAVLLTHAHYDHILSAAALQRAGAKVYLHRDDVENLQGRGNLADLFCERLDPFVPDVLLSGGETLTFADKISFCVLHTPGHTSGGVCYRTDDVIFSGDTLLYNSIGRSDFPTGDGARLRKSIRESLFVLPETCRVLPGHGRETTIGREKQYNPHA